MKMRLIALLVFLSLALLAWVSMALSEAARRERAAASIPPIVNVDYQLCARVVPPPLTPRHPRRVDNLHPHPEIS